MAETKRMTTEQVVGYLLEGEGLDFLRERLDAESVEGRRAGSSNCGRPSRSRISSRRGRELGQRDRKRGERRRELDHHQRRPTATV